MIYSTSNMELSLRDLFYKHDKVTLINKYSIKARIKFNMKHVYDLKSHIVIDNIGDFERRKVAIHVVTHNAFSVPQQAVLVTEAPMHLDTFLDLSKHHNIVFYRPPAWVAHESHLTKMCVLPEDLSLAATILMEFGKSSLMTSDPLLSVAKKMYPNAVPIQKNQIDSIAGTFGLSIASIGKIIDQCARRVIYPFSVKEKPDDLDSLEAINLMIDSSLSCGNVYLLDMSRDWSGLGIELSTNYMMQLVNFGYIDIKPKINMMYLETILNVNRGYYKRLSEWHKIRASIDDASEYSHLAQSVEAHQSRLHYLQSRSSPAGNPR